MIYVNKMDIMGADFYHVLDMTRDRLKANTVPIQLPIGKEETFKGIIDLLEMKAYNYYDDLGKDIRVEEIPEDMKELAQKYHDELIEAIAENDEELMMKYLDGEELTMAEMKAAIRKETIANTIVPVTCGTSYKNKGVQKLLDAIVDYTPAPTDIEDIKGVNPHGRGGEPPVFGRRALLCAGVQNCHRPVCGQAVLLPRVSGHGAGRHHGVQLCKGQP